MTPHQLHILDLFVADSPKLGLGSPAVREVVRAILAERREMLTTLELIRDWLADPSRVYEMNFNRGLIANVIDRATGGEA